MADENFEFPEFFVYRHLGLVGCNIGHTMNKATQLLLFICLNILIGQVDYQTQIQTIFNSNCTSCHINGGAYYGGKILITTNR